LSEGPLNVDPPSFGNVLPPKGCFFVISASSGSYSYSGSSALGIPNLPAQVDAKSRAVVSARLLIIIILLLLVVLVLVFLAFLVVLVVLVFLVLLL
jgi:hypothetical protein